MTGADGVEVVPGWVVTAGALSVVVVGETAQAETMPESIAANNRGTSLPFMCRSHCFAL
ncbi:MAG: hypothetical protein ACREBC_24930 [Pyrinomonadaceae bacterium]